MQTPQTAEHKAYPLGKPGQIATYQHESEDSLPDTVVKTLTVAIDSVEEKASVLSQWNRHPEKSGEYPLRIFTGCRKANR